MLLRALSPLRLTQHSSIRVFIVSLILFCLVVLYGQTHFYRDPGSIFFDELRAFQREYTVYREQEANVYIQSVKDGKDRLFPKAGTSPSICASFITVKRDGEQYIENAIGSVLEGLSDQERSDLYLSVFFANTNPNVHPGWGNGSWIHNVVDSVYSYELPDFEFWRYERFEKARNFLIKGVFDYTYALQHCYDKDIPWVLILEDDILAAPTWFLHTLKGLRNIASLSSPDEWLYMRLFNQERSTGWASRHVGGNNEHWISLAFGGLLCLAVLRMRKRYHQLQRYLDNWTLAVLCIVVIPAFVVLFFQSGKASVLPPTPGVKTESFGCCSQALVFPRNQIPDVINYLQGKKSGQVDILLNQRAKAAGLSRFALYPVQVQHIGIQSGRGTNDHEAKSIWSMAFEKLDPQILRDEHASMLAAVYPIRT